MSPMLRRGDSHSGEALQDAAQLATKLQEISMNKYTAEVKSHWFTFFLFVLAGSFCESLQQCLAFLIQSTPPQVAIIWFCLVNCPILWPFVGLFKMDSSGSCFSFLVEKYPQLFLVMFLFPNLNEKHHPLSTKGKWVVNSCSYSRSNAQNPTHKLQSGLGGLRLKPSASYFTVLLAVHWKSREMAWKCSSNANHCGSLRLLCSATKPPFTSVTDLTWKG